MTISKIRNYFLNKLYDKSKKMILAINLFLYEVIRGRLKVRRTSVQRNCLSLSQKIITFCFPMQLFDYISRSASS